MLSRERRLYFLRWLRNPRHISVPVASSKTMAREMAAQLNVARDEIVVELGPGTGSVTRAILKSGISARQLIVIERDMGFCDQLRRNFPQATILHGDARNLRELLHQKGISQIAAVISSLPLLSMSDALRRAIVGSVFDMLGPNGVFIQYSYGLRSPVPSRHQRAFGIHGRITKSVWRNFPPANVWRYST